MANSQTFNIRCSNEVAAMFSPVLLFNLCFCAPLSHDARLLVGLRNVSSRLYRSSYRLTLTVTLFCLLSKRCSPVAPTLLDIEMSRWEEEGSQQICTCTRSVWHVELTFHTQLRSETSCFLFCGLLTAALATSSHFLFEFLFRINFTLIWNVCTTTEILLLSNTDCIKQKRFKILLAFMFVDKLRLNQHFQFDACHRNQSVGLFQKCCLLCNWKRNRVRGGGEDEEERKGRFCKTSSTKCLKERLIVLPLCKSVCFFSVGCVLCVKCVDGGLLDSFMGSVIILCYFARVVTIGLQKIQMTRCKRISLFSLKFVYVNVIYV